MSDTEPTRPWDIEYLLLWYPSNLVRRTRVAEWERRFCADMAKRAHWRGWWLTTRQEAPLREIIRKHVPTYAVYHGTGLVTDEEDGEVLDVDAA
jgi:hypothetical protein